jgi:hypothetical protein
MREWLQAVKPELSNLQAEWVVSYNQANLHTECKVLHGDHQ